MGYVHASMIEKKASDSYRAQTERCKNKNCKAYAAYGKKGITVSYSRQDFIVWYVKEFSKRKWKDPTVGRIDHERGYTFDNIEMQERSFNARDARHRHPQRGVQKPKMRKRIVAYKNDIPFATFFSVGAAADFCGLKIAAISSILIGLNKKTKTGFSFKYLEEK